MRKIIFLVIISFNLSPVFAQVTNTAPTLQDQFSKKNGNLRLSDTKLNFGIVSTNEVKIDTIRLYNSSSAPMNISLGTKMPEYLMVTVVGSPVQPAGQGYITFRYDISKRNDYGFVFDRIQLNTDDALQQQKFISVTANIQEFFPIPVEGDSTKVKARVPEVSYSYGTLKQGDKTSHDFKVYNDGNKTLLLHKTKTNCGCIKAQLSKKEITAGDSAVVHVEFDSFGKEGNDTRPFSLFVNDPAMPEILFEIKGQVIK